MSDQEIRKSSSSPSASTGRLNPNAFPFFETHAALRGNHSFTAVVPDDHVSARTSVAAPTETIRAAQTAIGKQRHIGVTEHFELTHDPIATAILAASAALRTQGVPRH